MKRILLTLLTMSLLLGASAQTKKCGIDTRALVKEEIAAGATEVAFLAKMSRGYDRGMLEKAGIRVGAEAGNIVTLHVPVESLGVLESNKEVLQYSISHRVGAVECNRMRWDTRTEDVQTGVELTQDTTYTGRGVYIGITDWGFDYTNPNYNGAGYDNLRIARVWDHFRLRGPAPEGFDYGTEIAGFENIYGYQSDTSNLYGVGTHGTHVAGICAGKGHDGNYRGQAPAAELLLCSFGIGEAHWMEAVQWMRRVAQDSSRRLVINSSWGMYSFSTLDGTSLLSQAIDNWSDDGTVFVTSAGNNGDVNFHLGKTFTAGTIDTVRTVVGKASDYYVINEVGQTLIMWGEAGRPFSTGFRARYVSNLWETPFYSTADGDTVIYDTLECGTRRVAYRVMVEQENLFDGRPHIQIDVAKVSNVEIQLQLTADSGTVHVWNLATLENRAGNSGCPLNTGGFEGFSRGDKLYGISEPGCSSKTITVAAHKSQNWNADSTAIIPGGLASFSSSGPLLGGSQTKPEISAPGYQVVSSINYWSPDKTEYAQVMKWKLGGRWYQWSAMSGTSMSSPSVTGIVALMLEANPALTSDEVREIIFTTAHNDDSTGALVGSGQSDLRWGWGKIDALAAVNEAVRRVGIEQAESMGVALKVFPNPASDLVVVKTGCGEREMLRVYTTDGRTVLQRPVSMETTLDISHWNRGVYIVKVGSRTGKLVVR